MRSLILLILSAFAIFRPALAQDWPSKPIRVVVGFGPGSTPDLLARAIFNQVAKSTGKPAVIENKVGAGGMIAADIVAKSQPDGHTLLISSSGPLVTNAFIYKKMPYDPAKDLTPLALVGENTLVLAVGPSVKAKNVKELLNEASQPGAKMAYGSPGVGTIGHLSMAFLMNRIHADVPHVPYGSFPQVITALLGGDIQMTAITMQEVLDPLLKAGRLRAIAAVGSKRNFLLPDLPTLKEQGIDFESGSWLGVAAPAGTSKALLDRIHKEISIALKQPEVVESFRAQGMEISDKGPADFAAFLRKETALWKPIIVRNNISLD